MMLAALLFLAVQAAADDLAALSDQCNDPFTLPNWERVYAVEGWGANRRPRAAEPAVRPLRVPDAQLLAFLGVSAPASGRIDTARVQRRECHFDPSGMRCFTIERKLHRTAEE